MSGTVGISEIAAAKNLLKRSGFCTENMWQTADVKELYPNLNEDECMQILDRATDLSIPHIWDQIHVAANEDED